MAYYYNAEDHSSLWKVDAPERGWGRTLLDAKHPERGEKYMNIYTNRVFYSEADFKKHIQNFQNPQEAGYFPEIRITSSTSASRKETATSLKRSTPTQDEFTSLGASSGYGFTLPSCFSLSILL